MNGILINPYKLRLQYKNSISRDCISELLGDLEQIHTLPTFNTPNEFLLYNPSNNQMYFKFQESLIPGTAILIGNNLSIETLENHIIFSN